MFVFVDFQSKRVGITSRVSRERLLPPSIFGGVEIVKGGYVHPLAFQLVEEVRHVPIVGEIYRHFTLHIGGFLGRLDVLESALRRRITVKDIGNSVFIDEIEYHVRPCQADVIPSRLGDWGEAEMQREIMKICQGMRVQKVMFRRACFALRNFRSPRFLVTAGMGMVSGKQRYPVPDGAVAVAKGNLGQFSWANRPLNGLKHCLVFLDKFGRPLQSVEEDVQTGSFRPLAADEKYQYYHNRVYILSSVECDGNEVYLP